MSELPDLCNPPTHSTNDLTNELQNLQFEFPSSTHVLPAVCNNIDSQWKQRLIEARQNQNGKHFVFIPYNIEGFVRTGILIKFNTNDQVEQVILLEPVIDLNILLNEIQKQVTTVYPGIVIQLSTNIEHTAQSNDLTNIDDFNFLSMCTEKLLIRLICHVSAVVISWKEIENEFDYFKEQLKIKEINRIDVKNLVESASVNIKQQNGKVTLNILEKILEQNNPLKLQELFRLVDTYADIIAGKDVIFVLGDPKEDLSTIIHHLSQPKLNESIILCDSSRFEISNIPEVDIANVIVMMKALHACKSVKFVILVSYENIQNQFSNLKDVVKTLTRIIPEIKDHMKTFSYVFTRFPSSEESKIYELLVELKKTISKADNDFMRLFTDLLQKTEKKVVIFNPNIADFQEIIEHLIQSSSIKYLDEMFQFSLTEQSKVHLYNQMKLHYRSIMSANNRAEHDIVKYKFDQLKRLNSLLNEPYVQQVYHECENILFLQNCLFNQTVLSSHLDHRQMQEQFLTNLKDSVEKLNYIFIKEILDNKDIENLQNCVSKLEAARNLTNLHTHISKEMIDKIYENFLLKIETYFQEISKNIHLRIKNQISFSALEQIIKQLDSIRTIPVIQEKTNQSYGTILEIIIEYLCETTKQIEILLKGLMQKQQNVSYYQLRKTLSSLNEAQWIKKYRSSAYLYAMHNIEEFVLEYIQEIRESVMKVTFNLNSHDKIEFVQKRLSEIDEMKYFEILVPQINQQISEVHIYYNNLMLNLCIVIQDSFSIEIWKQRGCPIVDFSKAENAFYYLKNAETDNLREFIREYSSYIQNEMKDCFDKIKQCSNMNKKDLFENARILSNRFQEIFEVKNKYPQVLSCFMSSKCFEHWQLELSDDIIDLEIEMEKLHVTQQVVRLNQNLLIIKALSKLDRWLEGDKYIDIYNKYKNIVFVQMTNILDHILNAIQQDDYETVAYEIVKLPLSNDDIGEYFSMKFKRSLHVKLDDLMDKTRMQAIMLADSLQLEQIKSLVKSLKQIQKAKRFLSQYFDSHNELDICIDETKQFIEIRLNRFLESIKAVIMINDFIEVEKRIDSITLVCRILGDYCSQIILDEIETLKKRQDNVVLNEIVEKYSNMDISEYFFHPPMYIFAKFEAVVNVSSKYVETFNKIKKIIFLKFKKELEQSRLEKSRDKKIVHLRRFESAVKYLPETIRNALEIELQHCKEDLLFN